MKMKGKGKLRKRKMSHDSRSTYSRAYFRVENRIYKARDWPDVGVATVYAILQDGKREYLGEVRAYNWESIWLSTNEYDEVDDAEEWWRSIKEDMKNSKRVI